MLCLVNYARARQGLRPLTPSRILNASAAAKAADIARCHDFSARRLRRAGRPGSPRARLPRPVEREPLHRQRAASRLRARPSTAGSTHPVTARTLFRPQLRTTGIALPRSRDREPRRPARHRRRGLGAPVRRLTTRFNHRFAAAEGASSRRAWPWRALDPAMPGVDLHPGAHAAARPVAEGPAGVARRKPVYVRAVEVFRDARDLPVQRHMPVPVLRVEDGEGYGSAGLRTTRGAFGRHPC